MRLLIVTLILLIVGGCVEKLTQQEWTLRYPPDVNTMQTRVLQEQAEAKIADDAQMAKIERWCVMAVIGSVAAAIALTWLKLTTFLFIPVSVLFGCGSGIAFIEFNSHYPKATPLIGAVMVLILAGAAVWFFVTKMHVFTALKEVVSNVEKIKVDATTVNKPAISRTLSNQSSVTKSIVADIRAKL